MMTTALSERQRQILRYISARQQEGWTPSVREIGDAVGLRSSAAVQKQLAALARKGYIRRLSGQARSIQVLDPASVASEQRQVPIVGVITAGAPILAAQNITGYLSMVDETLLNKPGTLFALKVQGESMI